MSHDRILVTGADGFVGRTLVPALKLAFPGSNVIATSQHADFARPSPGEVLDVTNRLQLRESLSRLQPDICVHLAAIAAPMAARANPRLAWEVNLHGALNIAEAIMAQAPQCHMLFISSAECYGSSFKSELKLSETGSLAPLNLYAATKAAAELGLGAMAGEGLRLTRLRPFNHTGPGQSEKFVVPAFAGQIARIEAGLSPPEIAVGALEPERDFLDVRDVCAAYIACIEKSNGLPNNQVINIASGQAVKIGTILDLLLARANCRISVRQDPSRLRPVEIRRAAGNAALAAALLGWQPQFTLEQTLENVLNAARARIGGVNTGW